MVADWANVGLPPSTQVDGYALENFASTGRFSHVLQYPRDGTLLRGSPSNQYWRVKSGRKTEAPTTTAAILVDDAGAAKLATDVSVSWSAPEAARLTQMGASLGPIPAAQVQKTSVYIISYLLGFASATPTPITLPAPGTAVTYKDTWAPAEYSVLTRVKSKYVLNGSDATRFAVKIIDYLLALGGH